eukprot:TRINITY_DN19264_c0_g1_i1.p3 TRINITY_DN19264_c0_g1~~TRINITY_DN19264_c0_g1_i1.p3  ORF type:complete len:108 (+),score=41.52 TRINITY_DN19264_c0_g1_i1:103-426(+)
MPCDDCNAKRRGVIVGDKWKDGAKNTVGSGGVRVGKTNMALKDPKAERFSPYSKPRMECKGCKKKLMSEAKYCVDCASKKGKCALCGKKIMDVTGRGEVAAGYNKRA